MPSDFLNWDLMIWYTTIVQFDGEILKFCPGYRSFTCDEIFWFELFYKTNRGYLWLLVCARLSKSCGHSSTHSSGKNNSQWIFQAFDLRAPSSRLPRGLHSTVRDVVKWIIRRCRVAQTEPIVGSDWNHVSSILLFVLFGACLIRTHSCLKALFEDAHKCGYGWNIAECDTWWGHTGQNVRAWVSRTVYIVWMWICVWPMYCDSVYCCLTRSW